MFVKENTGFLDAVGNGVGCPLGAGNVDIVGVIGALRAHGYDGWAVFEQDVDPTKPGVVPKESAPPQVGNIYVKSLLFNSRKYAFRSRKE